MLGCIGKKCIPILLEKKKKALNIFQILLTEWSVSRAGKDDLHTYPCCRQKSLCMNKNNFLIGLEKITYVVAIKRYIFKNAIQIPRSSL